jgi:hypothetical protein
VRVKLPTETVFGETDVTIGTGLSRTRGTDADAEGSAALAAITFTIFGVGSVAGAV